MSRARRAIHHLFEGLPPNANALAPQEDVPVVENINLESPQLVMRAVTGRDDDVPRWARNQRNVTSGRNKNIEPGFSSVSDPPGFYRPRLLSLTVAKLEVFGQVGDVRDSNQKRVGAPPRVVGLPGGSKQASVFEKEITKRMRGNAKVEEVICFMGLRFCV